MLTPNDAINGAADLLGTTPISVKYLTRLMRQDGRGLWPEFGKGNRGSISLRHLINLWMAYALCGGQPSLGPQVAYEFGLLQLTGNIKREATPLPEHFNRLMGIDIPTVLKETRSPRAFQQGQGQLVDLLCRMIDACLANIINNMSEPPFFWPEICVTLSSAGRLMTADVTWTDLVDYRSSETDLYTVDKSVLPDFDLQVTRPNKIFRTQVIIGSNEIMAFLSLAVRTDDFASLKLTVSDPARNGQNDVGTLETTKTAEPASSNGPPSSRQSASRAYPALAQTAPTNTVQSATKRKRKQFSSAWEAREMRGHQPTESSRLVDHNPSIVKDHRRGTHRIDAAPPPAG